MSTTQHYTKDEHETADGLVEAGADLAESLGNDALAALEEAGDEMVEEGKQNGLSEEEAVVIITIGKLIGLRRAMDTIYADIEDRMQGLLREKIEALPACVIPPTPEDEREDEDEGDEDTSEEVDESEAVGPVESAPEPIPAAPVKAPTLAPAPALGKAPRLK